MAPNEGPLASYASPAAPQHGGQTARPLRHHSEGGVSQAPVPKCVPATWPHAHAYIGRGDQGIEVASKALERTVTPEAHTYFRRIVQVTQSELEKLLVYKIQQLFDPVPAGVSAETALQALGTKTCARLQMPGASMYAHIAELEGMPLGGPGRHPSNVKEKAVQEGRDLTKYLVGIVGRILADFGRFADTVLRWEHHEVQGKNASFLGAQGDSCEPTTKTGIGAEDLVERLERQDRQNSVLESKYNSVATELRENRRAFMRERLVWREQLFRLKTLLKRSKDKAVLEFLERDVQFFDGTVHTGEPTLEELREQYELRIQQLTEEYEDKIDNLEKELEQARSKLMMLEELSRRRESKVSDVSLTELQLERDELKETISSLKDERDLLKDRVEELQAANDKLLDQAANMQCEVERMRMRLEDKPKVIVKERKVETCVVAVQAEVPEIQVPKKDQIIQASIRSWSGSLTSEAPRGLVVSILPEEQEEVPVPVVVDESELRELRRQLKEMEASREEDARRYREAALRLTRAEAAAEEAAARAKELETLAEEAAARAKEFEIRVKELETQLEVLSVRLADAENYTPPPAALPPKPEMRTSGMVTDPWVPPTSEPTSAFNEADLLRQIRVLEEENERLKFALAGADVTAKELREAQARLYTLKAEVAELRRQLAIHLAPSQEIERKTKKPLRAAGWNWDKMSPVKKKIQAAGQASQAAARSNRPDQVRREEFSASPSPEQREPRERIEPLERAERALRPADGPARHRTHGYALNFKGQSDESGVDGQEAVASRTTAAANDRSRAGHEASADGGDGQQAVAPRTAAGARARSRAGHAASAGGGSTQIIGNTGPGAGLAGSAGRVATDSSATAAAASPAPAAAGASVASAAVEGSAQPLSSWRPGSAAASNVESCGQPLSSGRPGSAGVSSAAAASSASTEWRVLAGTNMPVSGYCSSSSSRPASAGLAPDVRMSWGGGFSILHMDLRPAHERESSLDGEASSSIPRADNELPPVDGSDGHAPGEARRRPRTAGGRGGASSSSGTYAGVACLGRRPSDSAQLEQLRSLPDVADDLHGAEGEDIDLAATPSVPARRRLLHVQGEPGDTGDRSDMSGRPPAPALHASSSAASASAAGLSRAMSAPGGALPRGRPRSALGQVPTAPPSSSTAQLLPEVRRGRPPRQDRGTSRR